MTDCFDMEPVTELEPAYEEVALKTLVAICEDHDSASDRKITAACAILAHEREKQAAADTFYFNSAANLRNDEVQGQYEKAMRKYIKKLKKR